MSSDLKSEPYLHFLYWQSLLVILMKNECSLLWVKKTRVKKTRDLLEGSCPKDRYVLAHCKFSKATETIGTGGSKNKLL